MSLRILGIGTDSPPHSIDQDSAARLHAAFTTQTERQARTLRALYRRTGVRRRRSVIFDRSEGELETRQTFYPPAADEHDRGPATEARMRRYEAEAPALALASSRRALEAAELRASDLTHLVTVSCTGFYSPGVDSAVIEALGVPADVHRTHVGFMGCHGTLNALRVASSFGSGGREARVLVSSVELCSLHFSYGWHPDRMVANALFGDGAGALVGISANGAERGRWSIQDSGSKLFPESTDAMSWRIGDHGFHMTLSARVPDLIADHLPDWIDGWLRDNGLSVSDVASWAVHPGGPRIVDAVRDALSLDEAALADSRGVLAEHGNMSSATVLFILDRMRRRDAPLPCVAVAFGPGLAVETTLIW